MIYCYIWRQPASAEKLTSEHQAMHQGVVRDMEQQRVKRERQLDFDMQRALEEEYKREQNVRSSLEPTTDKDQGGSNKT